MATVSLPYTLTNGQTADASQVMANLNAIVSAVNGGLDTTNVAASLQALLHSPGDLKASGRTTPETGWLACDGSAVSRSTYAALFAEIGTAFGAGDGSTTFNLPDMRGRVPVGKGTHTSVDTLGKNEGLAVGSRSPNHAHTLPDHAHSMPHTHSGSTSGPSDAFGTVSAGTAFAGATHTHTFTTGAPSNASTVGAGALVTQGEQPSYEVVNFFIKT